MPRVYVAAGSNIDPERHLGLAAAALSETFRGVRFSAAYRNQAAGFEGADFVNWVAGFDTDLDVRAVRERLQAIEALCGRPRRAPKWGPRAMDLDILLYGDLVCEQPDLQLPRPDLLRRAYMLGPLADLAPALRHPTAGATIGELWGRFDRASHPLVPEPHLSPGAIRDPRG